MVPAPAPTPFRFRASLQGLLYPTGAVLATLEAQQCAKSSDVERGRLFLDFDSIFLRIKISF